MKRTLVLWVAAFLTALSLTTPARADEAAVAAEIEAFVKDNGKAILNHPSRMDVAGLNLPVIAKIDECYSATTVVKVMIETQAPEAKLVADKMISCKASIGEAILDVAAGDVKHGPLILSLLRQGRDVEEDVLQALAKDVGKKVGDVEPKLKAWENLIIKEVLEEVARWGLREVTKAAAYVERKTREEEQAADAGAAKLANGLRKDLAKAHNEACKVANQADIDAHKLGKGAAHMAKKDWAHLRRLF
jgi:hypothetical protein